MAVIDVDSHFEAHFPGPFAHPLEVYADRLPGVEDIVVGAVAGDLWRETAPSDREALRSAFPLMRLMRGEPDPPEITMVAPSAALPVGATDARERVAWMDAVGIDFQLVNPGGAYAGWMAEATRWFPAADDRHDAIRRCNDFLAEWTAPHPDRLGAVALVDFDDLAWSIGEIERMRARGARAVFLRSGPFEGRAPAHPRHDTFWRAMAGSGMVGVLHIGMTPADFSGGWADAGWTEPGGTGVGGYLRFANSARTESAQKLIANLVFGGTFVRVPAATIVLEELWAGWLSWFVTRFGGLAETSGALGAFDSPLAPDELVRRNVKVSPLPGLGDDGAAVLPLVPEMLVFSSDFPHAEGNVDPITIYDDLLAAQPAEVRTAFLGATMTEVFARTGDPLPVR